MRPHDPDCDVRRRLRGGAGPALLLLVLRLSTAGEQAPAAGRCTIGAQRQVFAGCRIGPMTYPPRTEVCAPSPAEADWYVQEAAYGTHELVGTGGGLTLSARPARRFDAQATEQALVQALQAARARGAAGHAQRLERLLRGVRNETLPLGQAEAVEGSVTLRP